MHRLRMPLLLMLLCMWAWLPLASHAEEVVRIGVLAKRGDEKTLNRWQPTADYLSAQIPGYRFRVVPLGFEEIDKAVAHETIDFVLANSGIYVDVEKRYGVGRIATLRNRNGHLGYTLFGGVIFTRKDRSDINSLKDLAGKRFAAVKSNSLGGYLMGWREMAQAGLTPSKDTQLRFAGTHDAVVYSVLRGLADAGTVRTDTLERMDSEGKIDLADIKVLNPQNHVGFDYLCSTRLYPEWPFAKLRHTSDMLSHKVATALLSMPPDSAAAKAGQIYGWTVPRNYQPVHELMRELHVGPYKDLGKITFEDLLRNYWHWLLLTLLALIFLGSATGYVTRLNMRLRDTEGELIEARDHLAEKVRERTAELEESHRRLQRISRDWNDAFDAISDPIFIHDSDMRIVQANPAYCERAAQPLEAIQGKPYFEFFPKMDGPMPACTVFPEALQAEGDELVLDSGEVFVSRSFGIRRADNTVQHAIHILEDVTDVRRAEARRRILSRAVEQAAEGILILDRDREVIYCNPGLSHLLGQEHNEEHCSPRRNGVDALVQPHFAEALRALFTQAEGGASASDELELHTEGGAPRPVFITVSELRAEDDDVEGYVMTLFDLSEVRQAEEALTYRIGFESVVSAIASRLVNVALDRIDIEIDLALQRLGAFAGTDRAYLFYYDAGRETITNTHEWCAEGVSPQHQNRQNISFKRLPWLRERLLAGEVVNVPEIDVLPDEAQAEREEFEREGTQSLVLVPLQYDRRLFGFIGFDHVSQQRTWKVEDIRLLRTAGEVIVNSLGRTRAMRQLQHSEASLATAQHIAHLGNWEWNIETGELAWSDEIYRIFGLLPHEFGATYEAFLRTIHPADRDAVVEAVNKAVTGEQDYAIDHRILRPDFSERIVHEVGEVEFDHSGTATRMIGTVQDVTELRQSEQETKRLNRALRTLSLCNTTMVHARSERALMQDICRILIEYGGYRFAWVGYGEEDAERSITVAASAGSGESFTTSVPLSWSEQKDGRNPPGEAIRHAHTVVVRDIASADDCFEPWRIAALKSGYVSVIALPLVSEGKVLGVITIDSTERNAFDEAEIHLLEEMSGDLAFGIRTLRNRAERERTEAVLKQTEERYEELYENAPNAYVSASIADGRLLQFNRALCDILGYDRETLSGMNFLELYADNENGRAQAEKIFEGFKKGRGVRDAELQMLHADGYPVWVSVSIDPVLDAEGKVVESRSMVIDISARKHAEEERSDFADQLQRSLLQTIRAIALTIEKRDPYTAGHQERVAELAVGIGEELGLETQELEGLKLGALIHDIGKISVPSEILNRPGKLEPEMFSIIKTHPQNGYEIIHGIEFPWPLAEMVVQHHERLDGSGYPDGLKGDDILFESRILAVADVVEAMASHRPYRAALGLDRALMEIERGRGTLYDERVVDACLKLFREKEAMKEWVEAAPEH